MIKQKATLMLDAIKTNKILIQMWGLKRNKKYDK